LSVLIVGVADDVVVPTLLVTLLFVNVCVLVRSAIDAVSDKSVDAIAMLAEPLNDTHAIVLAVSSAVAVPALPDTVV